MADCIEPPMNSVETTKPTISFIKSQKGKTMIVIDEYIFKFNRESKTTKHWICVFNGCPSKIHTTTDNQFIDLLDNYNHPSEKEKIEIRRFREKIKDRAIAETTPVPQIYEEECVKMMLSFAAIAIVPSEREINSAVNKARRAFTPLIPTTQLFEIPEPFNKTIRHE